MLTQKESDALVQRLCDAIRHGDRQALYKELEKAPVKAEDFFGDVDYRGARLKYAAYLGVMTYVAGEAGLGYQEISRIYARYAFPENETFRGERNRATVDLLWNMLKEMTVRLGEAGWRSQKGRRHGFYDNLVRDYVQSHLSEPITVQSLAAALKVNRSYLSGVFKKECSETLSHFIRRSKIEEACRQIRQGDKSIAQIAYALGFSSQSHFTHVFRSMTGLTPLKYRESLIQSDS